ncbi:hypothetical protein [Pseudomonas asplenii]|uniref:Uncharacterized protein n=1 Tax=Pseudomonas asplenii TaxID=53407 RepID=A0A1H6P7D4_9PSED|nr:hypothetical protein [Pseudomonas fuscovaginae]SEI23602.1 hypothetical protein SAMN05216581_5232 [Pseudomonas fuscovaginae]
MQPARQDLRVTPGATYRDTIRIMQPDFAYRAITGIAGAPVVLTVPGHGLDADWPVWVRGAQGMPDLNREPGRQLPHRARLIDVDTLEINNLSASALKPAGGELVYHLPVNLADAEAFFRIYSGTKLVLELGLGAGLALVSAGTLTRKMTAEQTAQFSAGGFSYTFDVHYPGVVTRYFEGDLV